MVNGPNVGGLGPFFLNGYLSGNQSFEVFLAGIAAFFFSSTILQTLKLDQNNTHSYVKTALKASLIGGVLLALIYLGFSYLAAFHGSSFLSYGKDELLAAITLKVAGSKAGPLVCITIALACLTTAIALISSFTDFIYKELCKEKVRYEILLSIGLLITFFVSTFEFTSISTFLSPILEICYPGLIVLTILNILYSLKNFKPVKTPVFFIFILSTYLYLQN